MNSIATLENELVSKIQGLAADIEAIQQPRSDFALEHFVVGQHDTPGRQRMQAVLELQIKMFNIRRTQLEEKKMRVQIRQQQGILSSWRKSREEKELAEIEIERIETDLAEMNLARLGAVREAQGLLAILEKLPAYTYEQLQAEEVLYWSKRLARQALEDMKAIGTVGQGNLQAINQAMKSFPEVTLSELWPVAQLVANSKTQSVE